MKKKTFLVALALFLTLGLVACGGNDDNDGDTNEPDVVEEDAEGDEVVDPDEDEEDVVDGPGHATSRGDIRTEADLIDALSAESETRAWVAGLGADITMEGPLHIAGEAEKHSALEWTGVAARKLGFYIREEVNGIPRIPVGARTLTVEEGIIVDSLQTFFISDGPFEGVINGNVYVNIPYFRVSGVRINGDVIFATQEYMDTAVWQVWDSEAAEINDGVDEDYETEFVLYQSNSGFATNAPLSSSDATTNISNAEASDLVTGEVRVGEIRSVD